MPCVRRIDGAGPPFPKAACFLHQFVTVRAIRAPLAHGARFLTRLSLPHDSLGQLRRDWLGNIRGDILAGLVVALALIPEAIAFSIIAGVDPAVGL